MKTPREWAIEAIFLHAPSESEQELVREELDEEERIITAAIAEARADERARCQAIAMAWTKKAKSAHGADVADYIANEIENDAELRRAARRGKR